MTLPFFRRFTRRDPMVVTPLPYRDLRSQRQIDEALIREWRARVQANELRRAEARALRYLIQAS